MKPATRLLYLIHKEGLSPIFESVVVTPFSHLGERFDARVGVLAPLGQLMRPRYRMHWQKMKATMRAQGAPPLDLLPSPPSRLKALWDEDYFARRWLKLQLAAAGPTIIEGQGPYATRLALELKASSDVRVIYYMLGLIYAELGQGGDLICGDESPETMSRNAREFFEVEKDAARRADAVICISEKMRRRVVELFGVEEERLFMLPCCVDTNRFMPDPVARNAVRRDLGLGDRFVVAYVGGLHWWQVPDRVVGLFRLVKEAEPDAHFLVMTPSVNKMAGMLAKGGVRREDVTMLSPGHGGVPKYLAASDLGIMLRASSIASEVSSPIKFVEYLASGLPVLMSDGIGDFSEQVEPAEVGLIIRNRSELSSEAKRVAEFVGAIRRDPEPIRARCRAFAGDRVSWSTHLPRLTSFYEKLVGDSGRGAE